MEADLSGFNIDAPRWDQRTFLGRVKHFLNITDPRTVFVSERELDWAKVMVEKSRMGVVPPGTQVEQLLYAKKLYDSAFHPDTGEKMNVIGRMSFQLPGGMIITGFMLQFYRTMPAVIFWQWVNQSFNALVNYTNRNAASPTSVRQMALSYFTATTTAVATAVGMNMLTKKAPPLVGRWVPFAAVAAANCVNIPMMRQQELIKGICVKDRNENEIGHSRRAAAIGITQVVISRITMAAPGMSKMGKPFHPGEACDAGWRSQPHSAFGWEVGPTFYSHASQTALLDCCKPRRTTLVPRTSVHPRFGVESYFHFINTCQALVFNVRHSVGC
ncbi:sideroflexin-2 isoform X1 [Pan troglodytes]|uniref:sideroflexin-2 isoform X1 n=1 Tax=Pan troglodytes TaxID=9598 RepID=UPI0023F493CB|nr:sideroflexin-2 isoform X2 [Pan troglodytes]XP_054516448.1 sideroflexin-2 isoform X2 [Pan troglodytes]